MNKPADDTNAKPTAVDKKNIAALQKIKARVAKNIEKFEFHLAAETTYHYIWHEFADKIIENYKPRLAADAKQNDRAAAYQSLETMLLESLKMLHPFMPFVTEEIYQKFLPAEAKAKEGCPGKILMAEHWDNISE